MIKIMCLLLSMLLVRSWNRGSQMIYTYLLSMGSYSLYLFNVYQCIAILQIAAN